MSTGIHTPVPPVRRRTSTAALGVVRTMRPRQWVKNVLVGAAPLSAGLLFDVDVVITTALAFASFCLAASAVYLLNDTLDVEADRAHPTKRERPIAAGIVPVPAAAVTAVVLAAASLAVAALASWQLVALMGVYLAVQVAYCLRLKHEPVLDIAIVASGFLLRAIAGGVASDIPLSQWFLLVTAFGSLFMVSGKRYSEIRLAEAAGGVTRASLLRYSATYLRFVWSLSASVMVTAYALWAFEIREDAAVADGVTSAAAAATSAVASGGGSTWSAISIVPFVLAVLRYAVDVDGGRAGAPEDIALRDRVLQVVALAWVACFALGVYT